MDDGALKQRTVYTGVYHEDLQAALPIAPESNLILALGADGYAAHFAEDYRAAFRPLLILELNGKPAEEWDKGLASGVGLPPFYINSAKFKPRATETAVGQKEGPRYPYTVVKLEFTTAARTLDRLKLKPGGSMPQWPDRSWRCVTA